MLFSSPLLLLLGSAEVDTIDQKTLKIVISGSFETNCEKFLVWLTKASHFADICWFACLLCNAIFSSWRTVVENKLSKVDNLVNQIKLHNFTSITHFCSLYIVWHNVTFPVFCVSGDVNWYRIVHASWFRFTSNLFVVKRLYTSIFLQG